MFPYLNRWQSSAEIPGTRERSRTQAQAKDPKKDPHIPTQATSRIPPHSVLYPLYRLRQWAQAVREPWRRWLQFRDRSPVHHAIDFYNKVGERAPEAREDSDWGRDVVSTKIVSADPERKPATPETLLGENKRYKKTDRDHFYQHSLGNQRCQPPGLSTQGKQLHDCQTHWRTYERVRRSRRYQPNQESRAGLTRPQKYSNPKSQPRSQSQK